MLPRVRPTTALLLATGAVVMVAGVALRIPIALYHGPADQLHFNAYLFDHMGSYSDVASLYFRDHLWAHPVPYLDYPLEYPAGTGVVVWLLGFVHGSVTAYAFTTFVVLIAAALTAMAIGARVPGSNMWLLALSPLLALEIPVSWDAMGILATVAAVLLFIRERDTGATIALAAGVWLKFFPVVLVPLFVGIRLVQGRRRNAWWIGWVFVVASIVVNAPLAIARDGGFHLRPGWTWFFRYTANRGREVNLWNAFDPLHLSTTTINWAGLVALVFGLAAIGVLLWRVRRRGPIPTSLVVPASLAAVAWLLFLGKVYSPQYGLWIMALLALAGAPTALAVSFAAVDAAYFLVSFVALKVGSYGPGAGHWFYANALLPAMAVREALILAVVAYAVVRLRRATGAMEILSPASRPSPALPR